MIIVTKLSTLSHVINTIVYHVVSWINKHLHKHDHSNMYTNTHTHTRARAHTHTHGHILCNDHHVMIVAS